MCNNLKVERKTSKDGFPLSWDRQNMEAEDEFFGR